LKVFGHKTFVVIWNFDSFCHLNRWSC
jgi:hypothetical protein